jgi:hypothetical protein
MTERSQEFLPEGVTTACMPCGELLTIETVTSSDLQAKILPPA